MPRFWGLRSLLEIGETQDGTIVLVENIEDIEPQTWTVLETKRGRTLREDTPGTYSRDEIAHMRLHEPDGRDAAECPDCATLIALLYATNAQDNR